MPASYSASYRFVLPATGEEAGNWGDIVNFFTGTLLEDALSGSSTIDLTAGDHTLSVSVPGGTVDEARRAVLRLIGSPVAARTVTIPAVKKPYMVSNATAQAVTVKTASGTGHAVPAGARVVVWCDGADTHAFTPALIGTAAAVATPDGSTLGGGSGRPGAKLVAPEADGLALVLRGRALDNASVVAFQKADGTATGRLEIDPTGVELFVGASTLAATFKADGDVDLPGALTAAGGLSTDGPLDADGAATLRDGVAVTGAASIDGMLLVQAAGFPTKGTVVLGNNLVHYLHFDGADYYFGHPDNTSHIYVQGERVWHTGNLPQATLDAKAPLVSPAFSGSLSVTDLVQTPTVSARGNVNPTVYVYDVNSGVAGGIMMSGDGFLHLARTDGNGAYLGSRAYLDASDNLFVAGATVTPLSDIRLKQAFAPLAAAEAEAIVRGAAHATSYYERTSAPGHRHLGFLAQLLQPAVPEAVAPAAGTVDGVENPLGVADRPVVAALSVALAAALDRIAALEAKIGA